jgi:SPP1 family predicted phage head-tail adaptor
MQAGRLDRRVVILRRTLSRDDYGEQVETFDPLETVWAQKLDVTGRELFSAQRPIGEGTTRFRVRWRNDLTITDRLSYDSSEYDIVQITELGRQDGLELIAIKRVY